MSTGHGYTHGHSHATNRSTIRRRYGSWRLYLGAALSVLGLGAAAGFIVETMNQREREFLQSERIAKFDIKNEDLPAPAETAPAPAPAPVSRLYGNAGQAVSAAPSARVSVRPAPMSSSPRTLSAGAVQNDGRFKGLLSSPAAFLAKKTHLGKPEKFAAWLSDSRRVDRYLAHPLVRGVVDSPLLTRMIVRPAVVSAFLQSPAMSDPRALAALSKSGLVQKLAEYPGVQALLDDPQFVQGVLMNPQTTAYLARHKDAGALLKGLGLR